MQRNAEFQRLAEDWGIVLDGVQDYLKPEFRRDYGLAMDAQPALVTTSNSGIPGFLSTFIDPDVIQVLVTPNKAAEILGEVKKGDWVTETVMFPVVENVGEVSSYGDYNNNGHAGANTNFPQRQAYLYQTITEWGERELERAGLAKINWAAQVNIASTIVLNKFQNLTYFFGVAGLQNYGLLNDPSLSAPIQPGPKAYGAAAHGPWITSGVITATPNEIANDIQSLFNTLVVQSGGIIEMDTKMVLAMSPSSSVALTATNSFNVDVMDILKKNFPNIRVETAVQYSTTAGNMVQLIAENVEGQDTGYCAFNEKMRLHPVIREMSSFRQKKTQGSWGAVIRQPFAIAEMLGV